MSVCHHCRRAFAPTGYNIQFFCSPECRRGHFNAERSAVRAWGRADLVCQHCGGPVAAARSSKRFCSGRCRVAAFRAKQPRA
jgi:hypothetical protein